MLCDENGKTHYMPAVGSEAVDTVGAGDSMVAGFIAGYTERRDYEYALKLGTAAGAAFSEGLGTRDKIYELLHSVQSGE